MINNRFYIYFSSVPLDLSLTFYFSIFSICLKFACFFSFSFPFFFFFFFFLCFCFCFLFIFPGVSVFYFRSCIFLSRSAWVCFLIHVFNLSIISCFFVCFFVSLFLFFFLLFLFFFPFPPFFKNLLLYFLFSYSTVGLIHNFDKSP